MNNKDSSKNSWGIEIVGTYAVIIITAATVFIAVAALIASIVMAYIGFEVREIRTEHQAGLEKIHNVSRAYQAFILTHLEDDLELIMEDFSSRLPDLESLKKLLKRRRIVNQILKHRNETIEWYELKIIHEILQNLENVKSFKDELPYLAQASLNKRLIYLIRDWRKKDFSLPQQFQDPDFVHNVKAWCSNVIGIFYLMRYRTEESGRYENLDQAEEFFNKAINNNPRYARPHSMLAVINTLKFKINIQRLIENPNNEELKNELREYLHKGRNCLENSSHVLTDRARSIYFNQCADFCIKESQLFELDGKVQKALSLINVAYAKIKKVKYGAKIHPILYITEAAIQCHRIHLKDVKLDFSKRENLLNDVLNLVKLGVGNGFIFGEKTEKEFFINYPYFLYLAELNINSWKKRLLHIVNNS